MVRSLLSLLASMLLIGPAGAQNNDCLWFDGEDDHATAPNTALNAIDTGNFTVEAWVRGEETHQVEHPRILAHTSSAFLFFFHGLWGGSQYKMLCLRMGGINHLLINNGTYNHSILDDFCHHVAVAREDDTLHYFVDGAPIGDVAVIPANPTVTGGATLFIGNNDAGAGFGFEGNISQVRIWNRARSEAQIAADMSLSLPGTTPGLVAYWELNDSTQVLVDKTGTANGQLGATTAVEPSDPPWTTDCCHVSGVGVAEHQEAAAFRLYPNPAQNVLWVAHDLAGAHLRITDALGRVWWEGRTTGMGGTAVDVSTLPKGVYAAVLVARQDAHTRQWVKE